MRTRTAFTLTAGAVLLCGGSLRAAAQSGFNGVITYSIHTVAGSRSGTLVETASGNKLRMESSDSARGPGMAATMIIDGDAKTVTVMMPGQSKYMRMTEAQLKARMAASQPPTSAPVSIAATGRTETVAGVSCQVYHATGGMSGQNASSDVCLAPGFGFGAGVNDMLISMGRMGGAAAMPPALTDLLKSGRGVLKVTEINGSQSTVTMVATNIDRTAPPTSAFAVPAGYTEFQMPQMPAGMQGGMPGGMPSGGMPGGMPGTPAPH